MFDAKMVKTLKLHVCRKCGYQGKSSNAMFRWPKGRDKRPVCRKCHKEVCSVCHELKNYIRLNRTTGKPVCGGCFQHAYRTKKRVLYGSDVSGHAIRDLDTSIAALERQLRDLRALRDQLFASVTSLNAQARSMRRANRHKS